MSESMTIESERSKTRARSIRDRMKAIGIDIGLQQAYEILAAADGHRNWATMKSQQSRAPLPQFPVPKEIVQGAASISGGPGSGIRLPALLMGGTRRDRVRTVVDLANALNSVVVEIQCNARRLNGFDAGHQERLLGETKGAFLIYVEQEGDLHPAAEAALCSWMDDRRYLVVFGAGAASDLSPSVLRRFRSRQVVQATPSLLPDTIRPRSSTLTVFGGRDQAGVDAHFIHYAQAFAAPHKVAVLGDMSFGDQAFGTLVGRALPFESGVWETGASKNGSSNSGFVSRAMKSDADPIWIRNADECPFDESMTGTALDTICLCFETGYSPCVGIVADGKDLFFRKTLSYCPGLKFHLSEDDYCIAADGSPNVRLAFEGSDVSDEFRHWVRSRR
jgi:hypothetical protein